MKMFKHWVSLYLFYMGLLVYLCDYYKVHNLIFKVQIINDIWKADKYSDLCVLTRNPLILSLGFIFQNFNTID